MNTNVEEKLAGIIAIAEFHVSYVSPRNAEKYSQEIPIPDFLLRPEEEWFESILVGRDVKLVLVNGEAYQTKVIGFTLRERPAAIFVNEIPDVKAESLVGASLYVFAK